jgi:quinol monooxygenase YgiN
MNGPVCVEIAEFSVLPEVGDSAFIEIVAGLEEHFHARQSGFMGTELVRETEDGRWLMIQRWECRELAVDASRKLMKDDSTLAFRNAMDPKSVRIRYMHQAGRWPG